MKKRNKFYITTPIYYVNDKPHIGHAYTTLAADILARYYRDKLGEENVFFLTGTDEHGTKVAESALKEDKTPQEFADEVASLFKKTWKNLNIDYNDFARTTDKKHEESVDIFMKKLKEAGAVYEKEYEGLYCPGCEKFITKKELVNGKCPDHNRKPDKVKEKNYFFKLSKYADQVKEKIEKGEMKIKPEGRKNEIISLIDQGLEDFSISREKVKWGLALPFDKKQTVYVWVEALQNYISFIGYGHDEKKFKKWWPADVHLMAKDILKFHALFWPALLIATGEEVPHEQFVHGFFTINGQKMSKTLGNVIDPNEMVKKYGVDATRYLLISQFPFGSDGDMDEKRFHDKYNADLANNLGNLVNRVTNMIEKYCKGKIPEFVKSPRSLEKVTKLIEDYSFDQALLEIMKTVTWANQQIDKNEPWQLAKSDEKKDEENLNKLLSSLASLLCHIAKALKPFMPNTSAKITNLIVCDKITKSEALFPRIKE
ncbi:MAG: methionine--tRNA ligase [Patescibacteria group bacterium]|nr:methionine--tRNA ligase [Patescibacteria group bacterium]